MYVYTRLTLSDRHTAVYTHKTDTSDRHTTQCIYMYVYMYVASCFVYVHYYIQIVCVCVCVRVFVFVGMREEE